jgi:MFS family permease
MNLSMSQPRTWYYELNSYQWWVLLVATLGWLFDSMDQQLFILARSPALHDLLPGASETQIANYAAVATSILILGWATGGLIFGLLGDRWGRARTMTATIVLYSLFTGLSALSTTWWDFALYRFLCGLGIGGEYAAGVALVAEVMPERARPYCLGLLQGLSALGHVAGSLVSLWIGPQSQLCGLAGWRCLFLVGVGPALLAVIIRWRLEEPESWLNARKLALKSHTPRATPATATPSDELHNQLGDLGEILRSRLLKFHVAVGMALAVCGQIGLWGIGYWTPELIRDSQQELRRVQLASSQIVAAASAGTTPKPHSPSLDRVELTLQNSPNDADTKPPDATWRAAEDRLVAWGTVLQDTAGMCGICAFAMLTTHVGRRRAFAASYLVAFVSTVFTFSSLRTATDVYWMMPLLGFSISSVYGGYAVYFPELFPTRLRSTGVALCYNAARYLTAFGPLLLGRLSDAFAHSGIGLPLRGAAVTLASVYLLGLVATYFAPETHGRPLAQ